MSKKNQKTRVKVASANLGNDIIFMFDFFKRHPNKWHTVAIDARSQRAFYVLVEMGLVKSNGFDQGIYYN